MMGRRWLAVGVSGALVWAALGGCSLIAAADFKECVTDVHCGANAVCSHGYCLQLPEGCQRVEVGGTKKAFEAADRIPLAALLPLSSDGGGDRAEAQRLNAMRLAVSMVNELDGLKGSPFGLFVCDTQKRNDALHAQLAWMVKNLGVPAVITSGNEQTKAAAKNDSRLDAGTMIISATATTAQLESSPNVWRVSPSDINEATAIVSLLKADFLSKAGDGGDGGGMGDAGDGGGMGDGGPIRIGVVYENTPDFTSQTLDGSGVAGALIAQLQKLGFSSEALGVKAGDEVTVVNLLGNSQPQATVLVSSWSEARAIVTTASGNRSLTPAGGHQWYLTEAPKDATSRLASAADLRALEWAKGTALAQGVGPAFASFATSFRNRYQQEPLHFAHTAQSYDAMWLLMLAAAYAQSDGARSDGGLTGLKLDQGMKQLSSKGRPFPLEASSWKNASEELLQGHEINVAGASGHLDLDPVSGAPSDDGGAYTAWQVRDGGIVVLPR